MVEQIDLKALISDLELYFLFFGRIFELLFFERIRLNQELLGLCVIDIDQVFQVVKENLQIFVEFVLLSHLKQKINLIYFHFQNFENCFDLFGDLMDQKVSYFLDIVFVENLFLDQNLEKILSDRFRILDGKNRRFFHFRFNFVL